VSIFNCLLCVASNGVNVELEVVWRELVVSYFKVFAWASEGNYEKHDSRCCGP
jgi:hypothetical protein